MADVDLDSQKRGVAQDAEKAVDPPREHARLKVFISYRREDTAGQARLL